MLHDLDSDSSKIIEAVRSTGVVVTEAMRLYVDYIVSNMKAIGTWDLCSAVYGVMGGTAASHAINWKTIGTYNLTFYNTPTQTSAGILFNGTNQYGDTGLLPNVILSDLSTHLSYYTPTNNISGVQIPIGVSTSATGIKFLQLNFTSANYVSGGVNSVTAYTPTSTNGYTIGTRTSINTQAVFYKGNKIASNSYSGDNSLPVFPIYLGARNNEGSPGGFFFSTHTCSFSSIGSGFTDTQAIAQSQIVTNAQLILNRA